MIFMFEKAQKYLLPAIIVGTVLGALLGIYAPEASQHVKVIGDLFMHALFMLVVPLIVVSIVTGITALGDVRKLGGLGGRTIVFYISTTFLSVLVGLIAVNLIKPGENVEKRENFFPDARYEIQQRPISGGSVLKLTDETTFYLKKYKKNFVVQIGRAHV